MNAERLLLTKVPTTLTGVLQARLDGLPPPERLTLQQASVIGSVFWDQALVALDAQGAPSTLAGAGAARARRCPDARLEPPTTCASTPSAPDPAPGDLRHRAQAHTGANCTASWRAGWPRSDRRCARTTSWARRPGTSSWPATRPTRPSSTPARPSTRARASRTTRCSTMCGGRWRCWTRTPAAGTRLLRWRLLEVREATLDMQGDRVEQRADIDAMAELAETLDDDRRRAHAAWRRSALAQRIADYAAVEAAARQAVEWARRAGDDAASTARAADAGDGARLPGPARRRSGHRARRRWPRRARWRCAGSRVCA